MATTYKYSINQLTELTGMSYRTIKKRLSGVKPVGKDGRSIFFDSAEAFAALYKAEARPANATDLSMAHARLAQIKGDREALHLAKEREESAPIVVLESALSRVAAIINARLQALPAKLKKRCPELNVLAMRSIGREIADLQNGIARIQLDRPDLPK